MFKNKGVLDVFDASGKLIGREDKAEQLVRYLLGFKLGHVIPFVSVYGRSGSGKSSIVRFVCENLKGVHSWFVNLRQAKTIFGCANLILVELGGVNLKNAQGLNLAIDSIENAISASADSDLFVLILDEFDSIFLDSRNSPSEFIYKLLVMQERLRKKEIKMCIIGISNNVVSEYHLDDRVLSRLGTSEIFFDAYSEKDVFAILQDKSKNAFAEKISDTVLHYCSKLSSMQHGDARRAIDLLRIAGEHASKTGKKITKKDIDYALEQLQGDRVLNVLEKSSYHFKIVCCSVISLAYLLDKEWLSTSEIFYQYRKLLEKGTKPLSYRRVSSLLTDLTNTGVLDSKTTSQGRGGYGAWFKPTMSPSLIGKTCFEKWWTFVEQEKYEKIVPISMRSIFPKSEWINK